MYKNLEVLSSIMDTPAPPIYELYWTKEMLERIYGEKIPQSVLDKFEKRADKSSDYIQETISGVFYEILAKLVEEEEPTNCTHCQSKNFELLEDGTYECYDCGKTFEKDETK